MLDAACSLGRIDVKVSLGNREDQASGMRGGGRQALAGRRGWLWPLAALLLLSLPLGRSPGARAEPQAPARYVGSETCAACHVDQAAAWRDSHHGWALRTAEDANILGDFNDVAFEGGDVRARFFRRGGRAYVETQGPDGAPRDFEIKYTVGVAPLQQYLVELDGGRLQVLDIAWDTTAKRWFHLYPEASVKPGDGLHWSGPYKSWQARCAVCHQTGFQKGYDAQSRTYRSRWAELTVGCEACHGPGGDHVAWASDRGGAYDSSGRLPVSLLPGIDGASSEIEVCAACHSRRSAFEGDSPPPGAAFSDHYGLALLRDGLYHADGQIDDEVYVLGSFLQSKMRARGVRCGNCHDPHSTRTLTEGNGICTQCHNAQGRDDFPTLPKANYDTPVHHEHPAESDGGRCVSCHMPAKNYMIVDPRRDHSFRVPRPDLSEKIGVPNACTSCHAGRSAAWAAGIVEDWYPAGRWRRPHYGEVLHAGRTRSDAETTRALIALADDRTRPAIVRASAIQLLGSRLDAETGRALATHLEDGEPLIRAAAVAALGAAPPSVRGRLLAPKMTDPSRSVRLAAARATVDIPVTELSPGDRRVVEEARADVQAMMLALADFPETQMQIGGLAMALRNPRAADAAFQEATRLDPQLLDAWIARARLALALSDPQAAAAILGQALEAIPGSAPLRQSRGNVLVQLGAVEAALQDLQEAAALAPDDPYILVDIATVQTLRGENQRALEVLTRARRMGADGPEVLDLLATALGRLDRIEEARSLARELAQRFPHYQRRPEVEELLGNPN